MWVIVVIFGKCVLQREGSPPFKVAKSLWGSCPGTWLLWQQGPLTRSLEHILTGLLAGPLVANTPHTEKHTQRIYVQLATILGLFAPIIQS